MAKRLRLPNGFGSIYKQKNKRLRKPYLARTGAILQENGKYKRKILGSFSTYNEAYKALLEFSDNPNTLELLDIYNFEYMTNKFLEEKKKSVTTASYERYVFCTKKFEKFKNKKIKDLTYQELQKEIDKLPYATSETAIIYLNYIFKESIKYDVCSKNIATLLKSNKNKTRTVERKVYTKEEIDLFYNISKTEDNIFADIIVVCFYTGARISEILKIKIKDIYFEEKYFIGGSKTKAGIDRIIPIHQKIEFIFEKYLSYQEINREYLFIFKEKKIGIFNFLYYFKKLLKEYNINNNIHSTRHTFITKMKTLQVSDSKLKRIIGHSAGNITDDVYTHYNASDLLEVMNKLEY